MLSAVTRSTFGSIALLLVSTSTCDELDRQPPPLTKVLARLDEVFAKRGVPAIAREIEAAIGEAMEAHPNSYDVRWRAARLRWWQADGSSGPEKETKGWEAYEHAKRAVEVKPNGAEGNLYAAVGIAAYGEAVGAFTALWEGVVEIFNSHIDKAIARDTSLELGAPLVAKGRYYFRLPWLYGQDLPKSRAILQECVDRFPANLRAKLYLAETLVDQGRPRQARELLGQIESASVQYSPPEGRRIQAWARLTAKQVE